ncbi:hypothetical protein FS749_014567 [Ceratobasidium sp. UAMH 11750]|nr:hypothetical protein FS749_014567 [Ceratobasidium sp. UAMH 11750]
MQTGQTSTETLINGPRGHGALAGINPADLFGGANPTDPNMMQNMLSSPQFLEQMSRMMSDPALMDSILAQSPQLQQMDPQLRATFQSEEFRNMVSNPDTLRNMMQMTAALRQAGIDPAAMGGMGVGGMGGLGGMGGMGGLGFPPFGGFGGAGAASGGARNTTSAPSANLFEQAATGATTATTAATGTGTGAGNAPSPTGGANPASPAGGLGGNPFGMVDPALLQQIFGGAGGLGSQGTAAGGNPFAALGGFGAPPPQPPADPRPVEERFQVQLQQLQDMGFTNAQQNIRALLACGGRVDSAIEYILGGGGL